MLLCQFLVCDMQLIAIDFDPVNKFVYWSDGEKLEIKRSKIDGTGRAALLHFRSFATGLD